MRTIIAGSRSINDYEAVKRFIEKTRIPISVVISGGARGVDRLGERWAEERGIPVERYLADWDTYGLGAGPIRNQKMAEVAEALIAIARLDSNGEPSAGTKDMIRRARKMSLRRVEWIAYEPEL